MTAREMKDSGVEWIGTIPACWEVHRIKTNFDIIGGNGFSPSLQGQETGDLPVCKASDISNAGAKLSKAENFITFSEAKLYSFNLIPKGSVLFAKIGEAMKKNNRTLTLVECCADNNCQAMVPKKIDSQFSYYLFNCIDMTWFDNAGTVPCISNQKLKNSKIPYPSIFEQKRIAKYLNNKCAEIDSLTADIEKQIETLQEYKKSVITEAVTKGLDPNVEMKDSGVEWLEPIPSTWSVKRLKQVLENDLQYGASESGETDIDGPKLRYIRITDISSNGQLKEESVLYLPMHKAKFYVVKEGDILFARSGATVGKTYFHKGDECCFAGYLIKCSIKSACCHPRFFYYFTKTSTYENWKDVTFSKATIQNINAEKLANLYLPIPDYHEQIAIVDFLDAKCEVVDNTIQEKQKQLEVLGQYKQSLIYEYVTGKKAVPM